MNLTLSEFPLFCQKLKELPDRKLLINTINAHSFNMAQNDQEFADALKSSDVLLPDGISIVWALRILFGKRINKIAGADLFLFEMKRLNLTEGRCFFLGSDKKTLTRIEEKVNIIYPNVAVGSYSPPFVTQFSNEDNQRMIFEVNNFNPDVLFIGMTAPKQEKWAFSHFDELEADHVCSIGAVFDFFAGNTKRAPKWMITLGLEWLFRLIQEPRRMWKRYVIGNFKFVFLTLKEGVFPTSLNKTI